MAKRGSKTAGRKPRTDAQRNRERILDVAKQPFTRSGANASLDDIAGVGPGTLYRHFPTGDALLEAVYRSEVEKLAAAERKFAETMPAVEALRAWMLLFVDYMPAKHIIAPALNAYGEASKLYEGSQPISVDFTAVLCVAIKKPSLISAIYCVSHEERNMEGTIIPDMGKNESPAHKTSKDVAGPGSEVCSAKCTGTSDGVPLQRQAVSTPAQ